MLVNCYLAHPISNPKPPPKPMPYRPNDDRIRTLLAEGHDLDTAEDIDRLEQRENELLNLSRRALSRQTAQLGIEKRLASIQAQLRHLTRKSTNVAA